METGSVDIEHELANKSDPDNIAYFKFTLSPFSWPVDHLQTPINLSKRFNPQTYNWYDYKDAWINFLYVRPTTHKWFVKYCLEVAASIIPRWFHEWWSWFGGNKQVMPRSFAEKYTQFQIDEGISTLPMNIKLCKYIFKKRLSYIISWTFVIADFDRIKFLPKEIRIKG